MKLWSSLVVVLGLLLFVSCDESPTRPIEQPLLFEGVLGLEEVDTYTFTLTDSGAVRIKFQRLIGMTGDDPPEEFSTLLGLGLGRPVEDGNCDLSFSVLAVAEQVFVFALTGPEYCLLVVETGAILEGQTVEYTVSVTNL